MQVETGEWSHRRKVLSQNSIFELERGKYERRNAFCETLASMTKHYSETCCVFLYIKSYKSRHFVSVDMSN